MWVLPAKRGTQPRYEQKAFSEQERKGTLRLVVSPDGRHGSLTIGQDAELYVGLFDGGEGVSHELPKGRVAWLHVARGSVSLAGRWLGGGDGAAISDEPRLEIRDAKDAELVLWSLPDER